MYHQTISLKKSLLQFLVAEMKLSSHQLIHQKERFAYFRNGEKDLYLTKRFIIKTKKKYFYQAIAMQLLSELEL